MNLRDALDIPASEITDEAVYRDRRRLLAALGCLPALGVAGCSEAAPPPSTVVVTPAQAKSGFRTAEEPTRELDATTYNNFYEFGTNKDDPSNAAKTLRTKPWTVAIGGHCAKPGKLSLDDLLKGFSPQERIYRMRCVEGWSMVIPWVGFPLAALLKEVEPLGSARYVEFLTHYDPAIMSRRPVLDWPYGEGLRLDEALHPLTILAVGLYGEVLPNQNGAPVRLVVPWKYGFKSAKSIVTIRLTETQPTTAWNKAAAQEYGFYSNVNPAVSHPRWSQATERRIGELRKRPTQPFNGYADQVAGLYQGMDLKKFF